MTALQILPHPKTPPIPQDYTLLDADGVESFELAEMAVACVAEVAQAVHAKGEQIECREIAAIVLADLDPDSGEREMLASALRWILNALERADRPAMRKALRRAERGA